MRNTAPAHGTAVAGHRRAKPSDVSQLRWLEAEAGDGEQGGGRVDGLACGFSPGAGEGLPDFVGYDGALMVLVDGSLFDVVAVHEAAWA